VNAIETLMQEHQLILRACDALEAFADEVSGGGGDKAELGRFVRFIREFADARHHGKEEDILFLTMIAAGFPREGGPVAVMLMDHETGRAHTGILSAKAEQASPWAEQDRAAVVGAARGYADLLRGHIRKEDMILYPMARMHLPADAMARVDADCAAFEERQVAAGADAVVGLGRELVARHAARAA
jgi:hemerythrin-like domain-containing protein